MTDPTEESNPYLALRAAKIARNEARLQKLGLLKKTTTGTTTTRASTASASRSQSKKKAATSKRKNAPPPPIDRSDLRRSKRHAVATSPHETPSNKERSRAGNKEPTDQKKTQSVAGKPVEITPLPSSPPTAGLAPNSARAMHLDVDKLIVGPDGVLGRVMEQTGKAFVMEQAARLAADNYNDAACISFNKYSGVQEWSNALFLWINLGAPNCDVVNEFPQDGRQVTWFGGSRMHEGTRAIQRLMHEGKQTEKNDDHSEDNNKTKSPSCIVLWCRRYRAEKKTFTPYTCLGRLTYQSHEPGSRPLAFCWNLLDYDMLVQHPDNQVRQNFRSVVGLAPE